MERQNDITSLLYAELLSHCMTKIPSNRGVSIVSKTVNGRRYWYVQLVVGGKKWQYSIGPDTQALQDQIERHKALTESGTESKETGQRLVAMLTKGGAITPTNAEARVLEVLERAGVFLAGGVMVGSHAFSVYGNMLGVCWSRQAYMTQDLDIASDHHVEIAVTDQTANLGTALMASGMGFIEVPALDRKHPSTSFSIQGQELKVDLLTPMKGPERCTPVRLPNLNSFASPVRFLDYLLVDAQPAAVVAKAGISVNVPDPARFAAHKLVVAERRPVSQHLKSLKDRQQAHDLLAVLLEDRPGDILLAMDGVRAMPDKFQKQFLAGANGISGAVGKKILKVAKEQGIRDPA